MKTKDLTGKRFGKLVALEKVKSQNNKTVWKCQCDCGTITFVLTGNLNANRVHSCGCLRTDKLIERSTIHNQRHTHLYEVWKSMKQRCFNPKNKGYKNYGARGILVCEEWVHSFTSFYEWSMANGYKQGLTIDRIDNNKNYCPENCRWTDRITQANNSRWNKHIIIDGKDDTLANWIRYFNTTPTKYYLRIKKGYSEQDALRY